MLLETRIQLIYNYTYLSFYKRGDCLKVLITGASSGIGYYMAKEFSKLGYEIIAVARRKEKLEKLKDECDKIKIIVMDLSDISNCIKLYEMCKEERIDILVNNAGFGKMGDFEKVSVDEELDMIDLNIKSLHILTKLFLKEMVRDNKGYILNVASMASIMPAGPYMSTYYATKSYVYSYSLSLQKELKNIKSNVKVGVLCPGPIDTEFNFVAGGNFATRASSPYEIAKYTVKKVLKGKTKIFPKFADKMLYCLRNIIPEGVFVNINSNIQKSKLK